MNKVQLEDWQFEAISQILSALGENDFLKKHLIFKGAIILNHRIRTLRKSLDIDTNFSIDFINSYPKRTQQIEILNNHLERAISGYFERQEPVRYELERIRIKPSPRQSHPLGWDGYAIVVSILDHEKSGIRGLPALKIDAAAPEEYTTHSYSEMRLGKSIINAYSLERIAGEKARAFLMSLPYYRMKVGRPGEAVRVKDLYDLGIISRAKKISDTGFWRIAGREFELACKSRFVDCDGFLSFKQEWKRTEEDYKNSLILPKDIPFKEINKSLVSIIKYWEKIKIIPFSFSIPAKIESPSYKKH
jgi:hypothetical protein